MPKAETIPKVKSVRVAPYPKSHLGVVDGTHDEAVKNLADLEQDSGYHSDLDGQDAQGHITHPSCYGQDHVEKLGTFAKDLDRALKRSIPSDAYPYSGVFVLLLRWTDDDLEVEREIAKLSDVFANQFLFQVEQWHIPSMSSTRALQTRLYDFQNSHQSEKELLIVYYGGHSDADTRRGRSLWRANNRPNSPSLNWSSLQHLLETAVPHVLIILDCCFAANAARDSAEGSTKEILAACGRENPTLGVCDRSFTSVLVEEFQAFGKTPFTVAMLHSRLVTMRWRLVFTPIYALLSEHGGSSIAISPIPLPSIDSSTGPDHPEGVAELPGNSPNGAALSPARPSLDHDTRVLLAISVAQDADLDLAQWTSWLATATPWDVLKIDVHIESIFRSHSTLVIVSVPITAWDLLIERPAYRFIGFIRSQNLLQQVTLDPNKTEKGAVPLKRVRGQRIEIHSNESIKVFPKGFIKQDDFETTRDCGFTDSAIGSEVDCNSFTITEEKSHVASTRDQIPLDKERASFALDKRQFKGVDFARSTLMDVQSGNENNAPQYDQENALGVSRETIPWNPAEEQRLKNMREDGKTWEEIARTFPKRTEGGIKKHWYKDMQHVDFAEEDSEALIAAIMEFQDSIWNVVSPKVGKSAKFCEQYASQYLYGRFDMRFFHPHGGVMKRR